MSRSRRPPRDAEPLLALVRAVRERHVELVALEVLDPAAAARVTGGRAAWVLAARAHGNDDAVAGTLDALDGLCAEHGLRAADDPDGAVWTRLDELEGSAPLVVRLADRPASLDDTLARARALVGAGAAPAGTGVAFAVHADGIVRVLFDAAAVDAADPDTLAAKLEAGRSDLGGHRGSVTLATAPAAFAARFDPFGDPGSARRLMRGLKRTFDPAGVLSPGRFIFDAD